MYLLRHYVYGGQVFNTVEESKNITYNNISIYGACGMGYVFAYGSNHYQILNSYIGLRPGAEDKYRISTTADSNFDIADAVTLQKWLVQSPDAELSDWLSADICKDNAIDSVDLVMMRKMIVISK